jgi:hypothetical protein
VTSSCQGERQHVHAVVYGIVDSCKDCRVGAALALLACLVDTKPRMRSPTTRNAGGQAPVAHASHLHASDRRCDVRAVAVDVPRRVIVALERLSTNATVVRPRADDLSVAARGVEQLAGLAFSFPPCRHGPIPVVVKAS